MSGEFKNLLRVLLVLSFCMLNLIMVLKCILLFLVLVEVEIFFVFVLFYREFCGFFLEGVIDSSRVYDVELKMFSLEF